MLRPLQAIAYFLGGVLRDRRGNFSGAISFFSKVIWLYPNNHFAYAARGVAFQGIGDHNRAVGDFDHVIELPPRLALAFYSRGISWKFLGDFDRAVADQAQAITLAPKFANGYGELGAVYQCKDDFGLSITYLTSAIKLAPRDPSHFKNRGYAFFCRGDFAAAAADLRHSLALGYDVYAMLFLYLARARTSEKAALELESFARQLRSGKWPAAMIGLYLGTHSAEAALAAAGNPDERAEAQFYLGEWHLLRNNWTGAVEALQAAARSCPLVFIEHSAAIAELKRLG